VIVHGQRILAEEVERIVGRQFDARGFASLCNAVAWSMAGRRCSSLPVFTERVNVKDKGIDAAWQVDLPNDRDGHSVLLGPGWNVYQYKQRDVTTQVHKTIVSHIKGSLRGALREVFEQQTPPRLPARYVFFTNIDLALDERDEIEESIRDLTGATTGKKGARSRMSTAQGSPATPRLTARMVAAVRVEIVGAGALAAFLNDLPHLRASYFASSLHSGFQTWEAAWGKHNAARTYGATVDLIGRDAELDTVRAYIDDPAVRAVILMGPPSGGKSRLALEATRHRPLDTVVAIDPRSTRVGDLLSLSSRGQDVVVILDDPDPDQVDGFIAQALADPGLTIVVALPLLDGVPSPDVGANDHIRAIPLPSLDDGYARRLLAAARADIDHSLSSWIVDQAGGNPGILLLAADVGPGLRAGDAAASFATQIARDRVRKARRLGLTDADVEVLRLLSMLTHVGVGGAERADLEQLCAAVGDGLTPNAVLRTLDRLGDAGLLRRRGPYVEVVPPLLANHLASEAILGRSSTLQDLYTTLGDAPRRRLVRRLQGVSGEDAERFWGWLSAAVLRDFSVAAASGDTLRLLADVAPRAVLRVVRDGLSAVATGARPALGDWERATLRGALDYLLFRAGTTIEALRALATLAEMEAGRDTVSTNAEALFRECFHPLHPQAPLSLDDRVRVLEASLSPDRPAGERLLAIGAIAAAFERVPSFVQRRSDGRAPLDAAPPTTAARRHAYRASLVDLLMGQARSPDPPVARAAAGVLPRVLAESCVQGATDVALPHVEVAVAWALDRDSGVALAVADLSDALALVEDALGRAVGRVDEETDARVRGYIDRVESLMGQLEGGDFETRLRRWTGDDLAARRFARAGTRRGSPRSDGGTVDRADDALRDIAADAVRDPALLTAGVMAWLLSGAATQAALFFW